MICEILFFNGQAYQIILSILFPKRINGCHSIRLFSSKAVASIKANCNSSDTHIWLNWKSKVWWSFIWLKVYLDELSLPPWLVSHLGFSTCLGTVTLVSYRAVIPLYWKIVNISPGTLRMTAYMLPHPGKYSAQKKNHTWRCSLNIFQGDRAVVLSVSEHPWKCWFSKSHGTVECDHDGTCAYISSLAHLI